MSELMRAKCVWTRSMADWDWRTNSVFSWLGADG